MEAKAVARRVAPTVADDKPRDHCGVVGVAFNDTHYSHKLRKARSLEDPPYFLFPPENGYASHTIYNALVKLNHRGQNSAGIATYDNYAGRDIDIRLVKGLVTKFMEMEPSIPHREGYLRTTAGTRIGSHFYPEGIYVSVSSQPDGTHFLVGDEGRMSGRVSAAELDSLRQCNMVLGNGNGVLERLSGTMGIGHVRYSTSASANMRDAQPLVFPVDDWRMAIAFNGTIVDPESHRESLKEDHKFHSRVDTEVLGAFIAKHLRSGRDLEYALGEVSTQFEGGYALVVLTSRGEGELAALRDPHGIRPMALGLSTKHDGVMFASESIAFGPTGFEFSRMVRPGEMILIEGTSPLKLSQKMLNPQKPAHCHFELIYFSRPSSLADNPSTAPLTYGSAGYRSIYSIRFRAGEELVSEHATDSMRSNPEEWAVVAVPDSSRSAAEGVAKALGIPVVGVLEKNDFVHRSFILPTLEERKKAVELKYDTAQDALHGRKVILIDDSIIRGTTITDPIEKIRKAGASRVEVWISEPRVIGHCPFGIDVRTRKELIAAHKSDEEIKRDIGADSLGYQSIEGLRRAVGLDGETCEGCITGVYPTKGAQQVADEMVARANGDSTIKLRSERSGRVPIQT